MSSIILLVAAALNCIFFNVRCNSSVGIVTSVGMGESISY